MGLVDSASDVASVLDFGGGGGDSIPISHKRTVAPFVDLLVPSTQLERMHLRTMRFDQGA